MGTDALEIIVDAVYLKELEDESRLLAALYAQGLDNWDGYDLAQEAIKEEDDKAMDEFLREMGGS